MNKPKYQIGQSFNCPLRSKVTIYDYFYHDIKKHYVYAVKYLNGCNSGLTGLFTESKIPELLYELKDE